MIIKKLGGVTHVPEAEFSLTSDLDQSFATSY